MKKTFYSLMQAWISILLIVLTFFTVDQLNQQKNKGLVQKIQHLEKKNERLQHENKRLESQDDYLQTQQFQGLVNNDFYVWPQMNKKAELLVKESNGKFKKSWALYLVHESKRYGIDPFLVYELLKVETGKTFDPMLVGPKTKYGQAYGMSQFMENTAPWIADMAGLPYEKKLLFDPYYSMQLSLIYLDFLHHEYGNWDEALTAYHRGMAGLEQFKAENGHAQSWYANKIQKKANSHTVVAFAK